MRKYIVTVLGGERLCFFNIEVEAYDRDGAGDAARAYGTIIEIHEA